MFNLKPPPKSLFTNASKIPPCPPIFTKKGPIMIQGCSVPNHTLYIRNLPEKFDVGDLQSLFSNYGNILKIYKRKGLKYKQQAFIIFEEIEDAEIAIRALQGFPLGNLPMVVQFANNKSKLIADRYGIEWTRGTKVDTIKTKLDIEIEEVIPPNCILFMPSVKNTHQELETVFSGFAGFEKVRYIAVKQVAFIDFDTIQRATIARSNVNNKEYFGQVFKVNYARR
eukprot:NODE_224_length_13912_cov_0.116604.p7 type:complete len:225 gc:universal NODE_224_length_13912_cov_0.116604:10291-10965(+)